MEVKIQRIHTADYPAVADIINLLEAPWQTNAEAIRQEDIDAVATGSIVYHHVAVEDGRIVGHAVLRGSANSSLPQPYSLELRVHPDFRRRGIAGLLWRRIHEDLEDLRVTSLRVWVRERYPEGLAFARKCGFVEVKRTGLWTLSLADADVGSLRDALMRIYAMEITLTTLAEERERRPQCLDELHSLRNAVDADIPAAEPYPAISAEAFEREAENAWTDGFLIARRADLYLGMSCLYPNPVDPLELHQAITGVRKEYRGQGIATALKARSLQKALESGFARITTYVDSTNIPMLALNKKLGFVGGNDAVLLERSRCHL